MPTGADILQAEFPPTIWVVPGLFSSGLAFLGGRPKVGKSWLALQLALSVTSGGYFLGQKIEQGSVLYLALEDSKRRMQERMKAQGWTVDAAQNMTVLTLDDFRKHIGFLHYRGNSEKLYTIVDQGKFRLVVVDTMSRAFSGLRDLDKAEVVTPVLSPLQEAAISQNFLYLFLDHHAKPKGFNPNPVDDLMASTAKSAVADTLAGLYRDEQGFKKLMVTGRDMEETTSVLKWDRVTGCFQAVKDYAAELGLTVNEGKIYTWLKENGRGKQTDIAAAVGIAASNLSPILKRLVSREVIGLDAETGVYYVGE